MRLPWSRKTEQETQPHPESAPSQVEAAETPEPAQRWYWGANTNCAHCGFAFIGPDDSCMPPFEIQRSTRIVRCKCPKCDYAWDAEVG